MAATAPTRAAATAIPRPGAGAGTGAGATTLTTTGGITGVVVVSSTSTGGDEDTAGVALDEEELAVVEGVWPRATRTAAKSDSAVSLSAGAGFATARETLLLPARY